MATSDGTVTPAGPAGRADLAVAVDEPSPAETYGQALGALGAALLTVAVDDHSVLTVLLLVVALVPWALIAGGVRMPAWLFVAWTIVPAAVIVATAPTGAPIFLGLLSLSRVYSMTGRWTVRWATMAATLSLPMVLALAHGSPFHEEGGHYFAAGAAVCALAGHQSYRQRQLTAQLRWSQAQLDAAAAAEERRRVARDVHDVVAHSLTVVLLNVTGARKALGSSRPELAAEALERAETVGRESLDGVRRVVGLLRSGDEPAAGAPQPTARDLPALVEQQRQAGAGAGAGIELDVSGDLDALEPLAGGTVVRLVQEAVTNAQRHAPGAPIRVSVDVARTRVRVVVQNGPAQRPPLDVDGERQGLGLLGMRERVEALGGDLAAGPADRGWTVDAKIPLTSASAPGGAVDRVAAGGDG